MLTECLNKAEGSAWLAGGINQKRGPGGASVPRGRPETFKIHKLPRGPRPWCMTDTQGQGVSGFDAGPKASSKP